ncbi:Actin-binding protein [Andreprevotia sp. IGB-42]|uniref:ankyrin repeat domain-containing protein n=1 Tax=Andreprevotia sp. IGB-42 TaxID=2497473 RepID=UPI001357373E|nr:ankyrin repeat domain-containing protein [Andreprevotia sp. IGB-42]KAF0813680.1 Actin-binding protein [Andreprevotia sp. IGB-42]
MSEVWTTATICFDTDETSQRWEAAFNHATADDGWAAASKALAELGVRCVQKSAGGIQVARLKRFGRRLELKFTAVDLDSQKLLTEMIKLGATHTRASTDDSRTGDVTKLVKIGNAKAKEAEFMAAVAEFDDDFAFITALEKGKTAEIKRLLAKGISANLEIRPGVYPIHIAVINNKKAVVKQLIAAGADLDVQTPARRIKEDGCRTPLHLAVNADALEILAMLLKAGADVTIRNAAGQTPLHYAISYRHQDACKLLLEHGADPHTVDAEGVPALLDLKTHSMEEIPAFLAFADSAGLNLDVKLENGENLYWRLGYIRGAVDYLQARGMISSPPSDAYTGDLPRDLCQAIRGHDVAKVKALIATDFDLNTPVALYDFSKPEPPIFRAVSDGHADIVALLLDAGCDANIALEDNTTLLHEAARDGSTAVISLLLSRGTDANAIQIREAAMDGSQRDDDAMLKALDSGHIAAAALLLPHWQPNRARLEKAKFHLEFRIKYDGENDETASLLKLIEARLGQQVE